MQEKIRFVELKDSTGILNITRLMFWIQLFLLNMNRHPCQNLLNVFQTSAVNTLI